MKERDEVIQRRGRELCGLVAQELPREVEITNDADAWPAVSVGLLSRMTGTLEAILDLQRREREADAATLGRSLYEHAVHFAWLAADPSEARLQEWRKYDLEQRLKADADMRRFGQRSFTDKKRAELEHEVAALVGTKLILDQLAVVADRHWAPRISGLTLGTIRSFAGLYASLYRYYSGTAHPTMLGLNRVSDDLDRGRRRIRLEGAYQGTGPYGMATVVFGLALYSAASAVGWPASTAIDAVFERHPG